MKKSLFRAYIKNILNESLTPDQSSKVEDKYNSIYSGMLKGNKKKLMKYIDPKFKRPNPDAMAVGRAINLVKKETEIEEVVRGDDFRFIDIKDLHFETDPDRLEDMKIEFGAKMGGVTNREKIEDAEYELRRFRKSIDYWSGNPRDKEWAEGVFAGPEHYMTIKSKLGAGPHAKKVSTPKWNERKYEQWIEDVASGGGAEFTYDMAQNAKMEAGLIDWVKKNRLDFGDVTPLERIQYDIEALAESINLKEKLGKDADLGDHIEDFQKSDAKQFQGKSKKKIKQMATAAFLNKEENMHKGKNRLTELIKAALMGPMNEKKQRAEANESFDSLVKKVDKSKGYTKKEAENVVVNEAMKFAEDLAPIIASELVEKGIVKQASDVETILLDILEKVGKENNYTI